MKGGEVAPGTLSGAPAASWAGAAPPPRMCCLSRESLPQSLTRRSLWGELGADAVPGPGSSPAGAGVSDGTRPHWGVSHDHRLIFLSKYKRKKGTF